MIRRYWWVMIAMIPVGMIAGNLAAAAIMLKMPKFFESVGVIEVIHPLKGDSPSRSVKPRQFSERELGRIADEGILGQVADGLDLPASWEMDRDAAIRELKEAVRCELDPGSNRISIKVRCRLKEDARNIAMGIIGTYRQRMLKPSDPAQVKALADLNRQIDEQNERTSQSRNSISYEKTTYGGSDVVRGESEFEAEVRVLEKLEGELEKLGESIVPHLPSVTVHQVPQISESVASPDIQKNLLAGKGVGLLISPLLAWPVMVLMNRRRPEGVASSPKPPERGKTASSADEW